MRRTELQPTLELMQDGKAPVIIGGETDALQRLKKLATEYQAELDKYFIYGATISSKMSSWLSNGCISPRAMFEELKKTASNLISGASKNDDGGSSSTGSNWLMHELLWRDFFRFITKKYSSPVQLEFPACTGALV